MSPTPSSSAEVAQTNFIAFMTLFGSAQQVLKLRMQERAESGLGPLHLRALCLCLRNPGGTQQQVVQAMGRDKGQVARLIRELEERELLQRIPDEQDRRAWRLHVTAEGEAQCQWFQEIEAQFAADLLGELSSAEQQRMSQLLARLQTRIDKLADDAA